MPMVMARTCSIIVCLLLCAFVLMACVKSASACSVPVFRYILECWPADNYELVVFYSGRLAEKDSQVIKNMEKSSADYATYTNFVVHTIDTSKKMPHSTQQLWESCNERQLPLLVVQYPKSSSYRGPVWSGGLSKDAIQRIVDSPARQEIARRIIDGEAGVWVLLESGNSPDDDTAELISKQLSILKRELILPPMYTEQANLSDTEVHPDFSLIRISRDNPAEKVFVNMLMHSEPNLFEYQADPIVFPVFGRGRVFCALAGSGITEENIRSICRTMISPCTCEIKGTHPGTDLLMTIDWEARIGGRLYEEPAPMGMGTLYSLAENSEPSELTSDESKIVPSSSSLWWSLFITGGGILAIVTALHFWVSRKKGG